MSAAKLYTPEMLGLAVELAAYPPISTAAATGQARSPTCGSTLSVSMRLDGNERVEALGLQVSACAIGQAAAALFARSAIGRDAADIVTMRRQIARWLVGEGPMPEWPDLDMLEPARGYPGRHGAILLPWQAAAAALSPESTPA